MGLSSNQLATLITQEIGDSQTAAKLQNLLIGLPDFSGAMARAIVRHLQEHLNADGSIAVDREKYGHRFHQVVGGGFSSEEILMNRGFVLYRARASIPCRIRLYTKPEYREHDLYRNIGSDPEGEHGVILDCVFTTDNLELDLSPLVYGADLKVPSNGAIAATITNMTLDDNSIYVEFEGIVTEV